MEPWYHKILNYYHQTTLSQTSLLTFSSRHALKKHLTVCPLIPALAEFSVRPYDPCNNAEAQLTFLVRLEKICDLLSLASRVRDRVVGPYARKQESSSTVPCWNLEHDYPHGSDCFQVCHHLDRSGLVGL